MGRQHGPAATGVKTERSMNQAVLARVPATMFIRCNGKVIPFTKEVDEARFAETEMDSASFQTTSVDEPGYGDGDEPPDGFYVMGRALSPWVIVSSIALTITPIVVALVLRIEDLLGFMIVYGLIVLAALTIVRDGVWPEEP